MKKYIPTIILYFIFCNKIFTQSTYDIRLVYSSLDCNTNIACYDVQLRSTTGTNWGLAGQNYRLYYDASLAAFASGVSTLGNDYQSFNLVQDFQDVDASGTGNLSFESTLGFLNYAIDLLDPMTGGDSLLADGTWKTTSQLCFALEGDILTNPASCLEAVWGRMDTTSQYGTSFVEVSEWVEENNTQMATGHNYIDLDSSDGVGSCFEDACNTGIGSYDIQLVYSGIDCNTSIACYDVQLRNTAGANWDLAGQNYRLYYDASLAAFASGTSTLGGYYQNFTLIEDIQNIDASGTGTFNFESSLGFLNYSIDLLDPMTGGDSLVADGTWKTTSQLCFALEGDILTNPASCLEAVWGRMDTSAAYATSFVEVAEWVAPNDTEMATGNNYNDLDSSDGVGSCFENACNKGIGSYDIQLVYSGIDCNTSIACYDVQLRNTAGANWGLAGQNYRLYYDASLAAFASGASTLGEDYQNFTLIEDTQDIDASGTGSFGFESSLGFLNYSIDLLNPTIGGDSLVADGTWKTTSQLCFALEGDILTNPASCLEAVWGRIDTSAAYATSFVEVAEWIEPNNTEMATGHNYNDLDSSDGVGSCFENACITPGTYGIQLSLNNFDCTSNTACYDVQLQSTDGNEWDLAGQNYRLYYDASLGAFQSGSSLLDNINYGGFTINEDIQNVNSSGTGNLAFESTLSFLNYSIDLTNTATGGTHLPANGTWLTTSQLCFQLTETVINSPDTCFEAVWGRMDTSAAYATSFVEVAEWVAAEDTRMGTGTAYGDLGDYNACFVEYATVYDTLRVGICEGDIYTFGGVDYSIPGNYTDTLTGTVACDSIITLNLTVVPNKSTTLNEAICQGSSYNFNGQSLTVANTYTANLTTADGCDSIVTLNLTIVPSKSTTLNEEICQGSSYTFNGQSLTVANTYTANPIAADGCDSIVTLNLTIVPSKTTTLNEEICQGSSYIFNGQNLTVANIYTANLTAADGCDSIVTLNLIIVPSKTTTLNEEICQGSSYTFNGQNLTVANTYTANLTAADGCDSIVTLNLTIVPSKTTTLNEAICQGSSYIFNGQNLTVANTYTANLTAIEGCDSIVTLNLTVIPLPTVTVRDTLICRGENLDLTTLVTTSGSIPKFYPSEIHAINETNEVSSSLITSGNETYFVRVNSLLAANCYTINSINITERACRFDLSLDKSIATSQEQPIRPGDTVNYIITIHNEGDVAAYDIDINDYPQAGLVFDAAINPDWELINGNHRINILGPVAPNASTSVSIRLIVDANFTGTTLKNIAEITAADNNLSGSDPAPNDDDSTFDNGDETEDDQDDADIGIARFDLALTKKLATTQLSGVRAGDTVNFEITVFNQGDVTAHDVLITDYIPLGMSLVSGAGWTSINSTTATFAIPSIPVNSLHAVEIPLRINSNFIGTSLTNTAEISSATDTPNGNPVSDDDSTPDAISTNDGTPINNAIDNPLDEDDHDYETIEVGIFDLALDKSLAPNQSQEVNLGEDINYEICIENQGTIPAYNVVVTDRIPSGLSYSINDTNNWISINANRYNKTIPGPINPGQTVCVNIRLTLNSGNPGDNFVNIAEIFSQEDAQGNNIKDEDSTPEGEEEEGGEEDDEDAQIINLPNCPIVIAIPTIANICQGASIQLSSSIPISGASYTWTPAIGLDNPFSENPVAFPTVSTTYIVEVDPHFGGCITRDTVRVNVFDVPNPDFQAATVCLGETTIFTDKTVTYTTLTDWSWDFGDGLGTSNQQNPSYTYQNAGIYAVKLIVTSTNGCRDSIWKEITVHPGAQAGTKARQDTICIGECVELLAQGGTSFSWSPAQTLNHTDCYNPIACPSQTTTYYVEVTNDFGCRSVDSVRVVVIPGPTVEVTMTDISECGAFDGRIDITSTGLASNYQYSIDGGLTFHNDSVFTNLPASSYLVVVKGGGCEVPYPSNPVVVGGAQSPAITAIPIIHPSCTEADGSIIIEASGATNLVYSINGGINWVAENEFTGLAGGIYYIAVASTDLSCITYYPPITLIQPVAPTFVDVSLTHPTDCGKPDGSLTIITDGTAAIEYGLDNGLMTIWQSSNNFINLPAGVYDVYIRNAGNTCLTPYSLNSIQLLEPVAPNLDAVVITPPTDCGTDNATIHITATEGNDVLEYSIDGGINWENFAYFDNLQPGTYNVFIRNSGGTCEVAYTDNPISISYPDIPQIVEVLHSHPSDCGLNNGVIEITAAEGVGDLIYSIDGGLTWQLSSVFNNLSGGIYNIRVANNDQSCMVTYPTILLENPSQGVINEVNFTLGCEPIHRTITINASNSTSLAYSIDGGATYQSSNNFINLDYGTYDVFIRNVDDLCAIAYTGNPIEITAPPNNGSYIVHVQAADLTTCGGTDGSIEVNASGANLQYSIDGGLTYTSQNAFDELPAGEYHIYVKDPNANCEEGYFLNPIQLIGIETPIITTVDITNPTDCNANDATISITAGGDGFLQYSLDGSTWNSGNMFTNLFPGLYNVWVRYDDESCAIPYVNNPISITAPTGPIITECIGTNPTDCNVNDGSLMVLATGGIGTLQYSIDGGTTWQVSNQFSDLAAGVYSIAVANEDETCKAIHPMCVLTAPQAPNINEVQAFDPTACGLDNGAIIISAEGIGAVEYSIDNGLTWSTNSFFFNLPADIYPIKVRNSENNCEVEEGTVTLNAPSQPTIISGIENQSTCTGSAIPVSITMSEPIADYTIIGSGAHLNVLVSGATLTFDAYLSSNIDVFTVYLENADGCVVEDEFAIFQTAAPVADFILDNSICLEDEVTVTFNGTASPAAALTWTLDGGSIIASSPATLTEPVGAIITVQWTTTGDKTIGLAIDDGGCTASKEENLTIHKLPFAYAGEDITICEGECIQLNGIGSGAQYQWSPAIGLSATDIPNPLACPPVTTTYQLLVMSSEGCMRMDEITVNVTGELTANAGSDQIICAGASASLNATGGTHYEWSPIVGLSNPNIANPLATPNTTTTYSVTITNAAGCVGVDEMIVRVNPKPIVDAGTDKMICVGENTMLSATGGVSYQWSPTVGLNATNIPNPIANPTTTTTYTVVATDANGCINSDQVTITVGGNVLANAGADQTICNGMAALLNATGGVSYSWSPVVGLNNPTIPSPVASPNATTSYTVTVTNTAGCSSTDQVTIFVNGNTSVHAGADQTICNGTTVLLNASGGANYSWSPVAGLNNPNIANPTASPNQTTTYTVTSNTDGCNSTDQVTVFVTQPTAVVACEDKTICQGGSIPLNVTTGVSYLWTPAIGLSNPTIPNPIASPNITTTYTVIVTDINGCTGSDQVTVFVGGGTVVNAGVDQTICDGMAALLNASGGTNYSWSPIIGLNNPNIANPIASPNQTTTYTVTSNIGGCSSTDQVTVFVNGNVAINAGNNQTICKGETTFLNASGGTNYQWSPTTGLNNPNISNPIATPTQTTTYCVTATNAQGCTGSSCVTITVAPSPTVIGCPDKFICSGGNVRLTVNGGSSWVWSPSTGLDNPFSPAPLASPSQTTTYTVTGTDMNGCTSSDVVTVFVNGTTAANAGSDQNICVGNTTQLNASGGVSYNWHPTFGLSNPFIPNPILTPIATTTYTVTVTTADGCIDTDQVTIFVNNGGFVNAGADQTICRGSATQLNASGGVNYFWSPSIGLNNANIANPIATPTVTTTYTVTSITSGGCQSSDQITVNIRDGFSVNPFITNPGCCNNNGQISLGVNGGSGNYTYTWTPNVSNSNIASGLSVGDYKVVITDNIGCSTISTIRLDQDCQCTPIADQAEVCVNQGATTGQICLPIGLDAVSNYEFSIPGQIIRPNHGCNFENLTAYSYSIISGAGNNGPYKIDNWTVNGVMYNTMVNNMSELTNWMNHIDPIGNWTHNSSIMLIMGGNPASTYGDLMMTDQQTWIASTLNPNSTGVATGTLVEVPIGNAQNMLVTIRNLTTCCSETVLLKRCDESTNLDGNTNNLVVSCLEDILPIDQQSINVSNCNETGKLCVPIPLEDIFNYTFSTNGDEYANGFAGCNFDTLFAYTYFTIPNRGERGPYRLSAWEVDGKIYSSDFNNLSDLIDQLNTWDPRGNWKQEISTLTITGGISTSNYGTMDIIQLNTGAIATMELNSNLLPMGTELTFDIGRNEVVLTNKATNCSDYFTVIVNCDASKSACEDFITDNSRTYMLSSCEEEVAFCLDIPSDELDIYSIQQNGTFYAGAIGKCDKNVGQIMLYAGKGRHTFTITNELTECEDEIIIEVDCEENKTPIIEINPTLTKDTRFSISEEKVISSERIEIKTPSISVYTGFSPNRDGVNDYFKIDGLAAYPNNELKIYNRLGRLLFTKKNYQNDWGGEVNGTTLPNGIYYYMLYDGNGKKYTGFVQIHQ